MKLALIALLVLVAAATAGCAGTAVVATPASHPARPTTDHDLTRRVPCVDGHQRLVGPKVLRGFHAVAAVSCIDETRTYPGQGQWSVRIRRVAVGRLSALRRYFEQPSRHDLPKGVMCDDVLHFILVPAFVNRRGRWIVPRTPTDACGADPGNGKAARRVHWRVVSVRKLRLLVSAPALAAHCAMGVKDVPAGAIGPLQPSSGGSLFGHAPKTVNVCVFRTEDFETGRFVRGFTLDRAKTRRLLGALTGAAPSGDCPNQPEFATVGAKNEEGVWVEMGGCFRVAGFDGRYVLGSANGSVVHSILGG